MKVPFYLEVGSNLTYLLKCLLLASLDSLLDELCVGVLENFGQVGEVGRRENSHMPVVTLVDETAELLDL